MQNKYKTIALIVAAGEGARVEGGKTPKQYLTLGKQTILTQVVNKFVSHPRVDATVVAIHQDHLEQYKEAVKGLTILPYIIGGETRQETVCNALEIIKEYGSQNVLIHDACRPFVKSDLISKIVEMLDSHEAVVPVIKLQDTLKYVEEDLVVRTLPREGLYLTQTPQGFHTEMIHKLHQKYQHIHFTDDASLFEYDGENVQIIETSMTNFKITTGSDLSFAKKMLALQDE